MNIFCCASMPEFVSASAVRSHATAEPALLVFDLSISRTPDTVREEIRRAAITLGWRQPVFLEPSPGSPHLDLRRGAVARFVHSMQDGQVLRSRVEAALLPCFEKGWIAPEGQGASLFFNYLHDYVLHVAACVPFARRIHFPHGLDQPRREQLQGVRFYYRARGWSTLWHTWPQQ